MAEVPGNELPGYLHLVPSRQKPFPGPVHKIGSTSRWAKPFDDSLPDVASRSFRRRGEVGRISTIFGGFQPCDRPYVDVRIDRFFPRCKMRGALCQTENSGLTRRLFENATIRLFLHLYL
jgi:hypothetical protein